MNNIVEYYQILNLDPNCSDEELKSSYRKLAKKWHPDINKDPEATDRFKEVQNAYENISSFRNRRDIFNPFEAMFNFRQTQNNIWEHFMNRSSSNIKVELEFDSLSNEDSNRLLDLLRKEGFNFKRSSVIRMC